MPYRYTSCPTVTLLASQAVSLGRWFTACIVQMAAVLRLPLWTLYSRVGWLVGCFLGVEFVGCGVFGLFLLVEFLRAMESGRQAALSEPHSGSGLPAAVQPATAMTTNDTTKPRECAQALTEYETLYTQGVQTANDNAM